MDRSLFWFIIAFAILFTAWLIFLCLSTCLGEPLRLFISQLWERLLEYADKQPSPSSSSSMKWSRREGNQFNHHNYTRLGRDRQRSRFSSFGGDREVEEEEMELMDWRKEYRTRLSKS